MHNLENILAGILISESIGNRDKPINRIAFDSRVIESGDLFVAIKGAEVDGHHFISKAIKNGASIIVCENLPEEINLSAEQSGSDITYLKVSDSAKALGQLAGNYYDHPSKKLKLVGITGTNGKTTIATLLFNLYKNMDQKVGLLSTIENRINNKVIAATHTTPDALKLNQLLAEMVADGCEYAFMEVSSHALDQKRVEGIEFSGAIFTNLSHDHLDYHKDFKSYLNAKKQLFDKLDKNAFVITNKDDKNGGVMVQNSKANIFYYSLKTLTDYKAKILDNNITGLHLELDGIEFFSRLIGEFNAYNLLAVYAAALKLGSDKMDVLTHMSSLHSAEGRFDYVINRARNLIGIVDYAHTPDALEKVLTTILKFRQPTTRLITVVGCGGDRDKTKRPIMARKATAYSTTVIFTSDNPRTENADTIIEEMEAGVPIEDKGKTISITNRKEAIKTACRLAQDGDIILVAGKGHEKYQDINGVKTPFDDKEELKRQLQ